MTSHPSITVAPSLLAADFGRIHDELHLISTAGAKWVHLDVMDGSFVPPITFGSQMVETVRTSSSTLFRDVHLMIVEPEKHLSAFASAGAEQITIHQEVTANLHRTLGEIKALGVKAGVAVNPGTPVHTIFEVLDLCDLVLIMTVNPGWGGQKFIPGMLSKIETVKKEIQKQSSKALIQVDGGINAETGKLCVTAGADVLVAGSYVFGTPNRKTAIDALLGHIN